MENFAEILKPKNWKKNNSSLLPGPIIMVDQSNTIISINWPYWRSLYHGHNIMQVKIGFHTIWSTWRLYFIQIIVCKSFFTSVGGDASCPCKIKPGW
jgi:hypothetical protein